MMPPGVLCTTAQIPSSNNVMLAAMLDGLPCDVRDYGIVQDSSVKLQYAFADCADAEETYAYWFHIECAEA